MFAEMCDVDHGAPNHGEQEVICHSVPHRINESAANKSLLEWNQSCSTKFLAVGYSELFDHWAVSQANTCICNFCGRIFEGIGSITEFQASSGPYQDILYDHASQYRQTIVGNT